MRRFVLFLLPFLTACVATQSAVPAQDTFVTDGPPPEIFIDGTAAPFVLRPGLTLPERQRVSWGGKTFSFRWLESGGERPYPPPPGSDDLIYPNMAFVGGTDDPREAIVVMLVVCDGGYDPAMSMSYGALQRYGPTGEWVFDVGFKACDGT